MLAVALGVGLAAAAVTAQAQPSGATALPLLPGAAAPPPGVTAPPPGHDAARSPAVGRAAQPSRPVRFVALGDQPYGDNARIGPAYRRLIDLINAERVPVAIHVGDFKRGWAPCSDAIYEQQAEHFQRFATALVYTPGDNDWSDCRQHRDDPLERLQALRRRFYAGADSLGARPLPVERQPDAMPEHAAYRENQRWWLDGVLFVTLHTVGPDDNAKAASAALRAEQRLREAANVAWLRAAFALARERGARALVVATQADVLRRNPGFGRRAVRAPFRPLFEATLMPLARAARFPVLLAHGDSHRYLTDRPFTDASGRAVDNLWRLQVPGDMRMHAVEVTVDAAAPRPFAFRLLWNALAPDPH